MGEMLVNSAFFGALLTIGSYLTGLWIKKKFKKSFLNPLLISILLTVGLLLLLRVDYPTYEAGAKYVSYLLTPATVCLAVPLYEQFQLLKKNAKALHQGTVDIAKESERGIVDIETLTETNKELIATLDEVQKIQDEGREKRRAAEVELAKIEGELKEKLIRVSDTAKKQSDDGDKA